jgi:hypothetical protein
MVVRAKDLAHINLKTSTKPNKSKNVWRSIHFSRICKCSNFYRKILKIHKKSCEWEWGVIYNIHFFFKFSVPSHHKMSKMVKTHCPKKFKKKFVVDLPPFPFTISEFLEFFGKSYYFYKNWKNVWSAIHFLTCSALHLFGLKLVALSSLQNFSSW